MDKVRLLTRDGGFVVSGSIPRFNETPAVLLWGTRAFSYDVTDDQGEHVYIETFAVYLVLTD